MVARSNERSDAQELSISLKEELLTRLIADNGVRIVF